MVKKRVGILTGGGDCSGLNPAIRAFVKACHPDFEVFGFQSSWKGLIENKGRVLTPLEVNEWIVDGGTFLGSAKVFPLSEERYLTDIQATVKTQNLEALVVIGGDDTLSVTYEVGKKIDLPVIGIPKTIDNDIVGTDFTIGFWSAVEAITEAADRLRTTARSHQRAIVIEVMGRHAGWLAAYGGVSAGADLILCPEDPRPLEDCFHELKCLRERGQAYAIIVVAEGAKLIGEDGKEIQVYEADDKDPRARIRFGGIGDWLADQIDQQFSWDTRVVQLGHVQRGGSPSAADRVLGSFLGLKAAELLKAKKFSYSVSLKAGKIVATHMQKLAKKQKPLRKNIIEYIRTLT